jgi:hypothetical protein
VCSTPNIAIPDADPNGVTDVITLTIADSGVASATQTVTDVDVYVAARHPWLGDLSLVLTKLESSHQVTLIDRPGSLTPGAFGCSGDDLFALFDDESVLPAESSCTSGQPGLHGNFITGNGQGEKLSTFDDDLLVGRWALTLRDAASDEVGVLERWCLVPKVQSAGATEHLLLLPWVEQP